MPKVNPVSSAVKSSPVIIKAKTQSSSMNDAGITTPQPPVSETPPTQAAAPTTPQTEGQPSKTEGAAPEAQTLPPQYEHLAKKEQAVRAKERELQDKEKALDAKVNEAVNKALNDYKAKLKQAPLDALEDEGLSYDQLVEQALNRPDPAMRSLIKEVQSVKSAQENLAEQAKAQSTKARNDAIKQIEVQAEKLVETNPDFETVKALGGVKKVVDRIVKHFDETGELLTVDEAAKQTEEELFAEATKYMSLSKVKAKFKTELTPELVAAQKTEAPKAPEQTTLTNSMTSTRPMTARERAIARFKGEKLD